MKLMKESLNQVFNRNAMITTKLFMLLGFMAFSIQSANAQKGLFVKVSLGVGYTSEYSSIKNSGFSIPTKNHAIGWGITDGFAVQIGEFGGLNKLKTGDYDYINLDAFGLGFSYKTPYDLKLSVIGAYSIVSFPKEWSDAFGDKGGTGYGLNISLDKEWFIAKRWGVRVGPQLFWLKTTDTDFQFINASINGSIVYYLSPVK